MRLIPTSEIIRNRRVGELMENKKPKEEIKPFKLTSIQMDKVKDLRNEGYSREEAVKIVLETNKL